MPVPLRPRAGTFFTPFQGFGGGTNPLTPSQQEVDQEAQKVQEEDGGNFFFDLLRIPSRLLGGESIKLGLKRGAEDGFLAGVGGVIQNNPLFQVLDILPGVDIVDDTDFVEVREAFGDKDAREGFGNVAINILGELATSPLEVFWSPFGKTAAGLKAASKEVSRQTFEEAVTAGTKALWTFNIPLAGTKHVTFKNFDVYMARVLDSTADWFHSSPVTQPIVRLFSQRALGTAGKANRVIQGEAVDFADETVKAFERPLMGKLRALATDYADVLADDAPLAKVVGILGEFGLKHGDTELEARRLLQGGLPYAVSRTARENLLEGLDEAGEAARALRTRMQGAITHQNDGALQEALKEWYQKYPGATVPVEVLDAIPPAQLDRLGVSLRPGVDVQGFSQGTFKEVSEGALDAGGFNIFGDEGALLEDAGTVAREKILDLPSGPQSIKRQSSTEQAIFAARERSLNIFQEAIDAGPEDLFDRLVEATVRGRELMAELGQKDLADGLITGALEFYFPRLVTNPKLLRAVDNTFSKFYEGRKLSELSLLEANALMLQSPSKALEFRSGLDVLAKEDPSKVWSVVEKIFPDRVTEAFRKMGPEGRDMAEFFDTNPVRAYYQRIKASSFKRQEQAYGNYLVEELGKIKTTMGDAEENEKLLRGGYKAFLIGEKGAHRVLSAADTIEPTLRTNQFVTAGIAKRAITDDVGARLLEGRVPHKEILDELRQLRDFQVVDTQALGKRQGLVKADQSIPSGQRFSTNVKKGDLPEKYRDHPYARAVEQHLDLVRGRDDGWKKFLDDDQLRVVDEAKDVDAAIAKDPYLSVLRNSLEGFETNTLEAVGKLELRANDLILKRGDAQGVVDEVKEVISSLRTEKKILTGTKATIRRAAKGKAGKPIREAGIEGAMQVFRQTIDEITSATPFLREGVKATADNAKTISRELAEVNKRIRVAYSEFDQAVKAVGKEERGFAAALRRNAKQYEGKGKGLFREAEGASRAQVENLRQGIRNAIDQEETVYREFVQAVQAGGKESKAEINRTLEAMLGPNRKIDNALIGDALAIFREQRKNGVLPLDWVLENYPEMGARIQSRLDTPLRWMDENVYEASFGKGGYVDRLSRPDYFGRSMGMLDGATNWWKAYTVLYAPFINTRLRDHVSGIGMQIQGMATERFGFLNGIKHYFGAQGDAFKFSKAYRQFTKTGDTSIFDGISVSRKLADGTMETLTGQELFSTIHNKGLAGTAMFRDEVHMAGAEAVLTNPALPKLKEDPRKWLASGLNFKNPKRNSLINLGMDVANFGDDHVKAAGFLARWKAGATLDEAAQGARTWAYIPERADLSNAERYVIRRLLPFYSWSKTAVKTQVGAFIARPATQTWLEKVRVSAIHGSGLSEAEYEMLMPEYIQDNLGLPTSKGEDGEINVRLFGSVIPVAEVSRLAKAIQDTTSGGEGGFFQNIGQQMNPWLKLPLENLMNESFYTQRDIERFDGEKQHFLGMELPSRWVHNLKSMRILNEIDALGIFTPKDIQTIREAAIRNEEPLGVPILGTGRALDPLVPARGKTVDLVRQAESVRDRQKRDLNMVKHQINRAAENGTELDQGNIEALQKVLLRRLAEQQIRQGVEDRLGQ